jgi:hypothetical protein
MTVRRFYGNDLVIEGTGQLYNVNPDPPKRRGRPSRQVVKVDAAGKVVKRYANLQHAAVVENICYATLYNRLRQKVVVDGCHWEVAEG